MFRNNIIYPKKNLNEIREDVKIRVKEVKKKFNVNKALKVKRRDESLEDGICLFGWVAIFALICFSVFLFVHIVGKRYESYAIGFPKVSLIVLVVSLVLMLITKLIQIYNEKKNWHYIEELNEILDKNGLTDLRSGFDKLNLNLPTYFLDDNIKEFKTFEQIEKLQNIQKAFPDKELTFSIRIKEIDFRDVLEFFGADEIDGCDGYEYHVTLTPFIDGIELEEMRFACNGKEFKSLINDKDSLDFSYLNTIIEKIETKV